MYRVGVVVFSSRAALASATSSEFCASIGVAALVSQMSVSGLAEDFGFWMLLLLIVEMRVIYVYWLSMLPLSVALFSQCCRASPWHMRLGPSAQAGCEICFAFGNHVLHGEVQRCDDPIL